MHLNHVVSKHNTYAPKPARSNYINAAAEAPVTGSQLVGCPGPKALVRRLELHHQYAEITMTDNCQHRLQPHLLRESFKFLTAASTFTICCLTADDIFYRNMPGWRKEKDPLFEKYVAYSDVLN